MSEKHTPAPWRLSMSGYSIKSGHGDEQVIVCEMPQARNKPSSEVQERFIERDSRLIAAAPDLLEVLKAITESFNLTRLVMKEQETRDLAGQLVADARAVIAKAEGR